MSWTFSAETPGFWPSSISCAGQPYFTVFHDDADVAEPSLLRIAEDVCSDELLTYIGASLKIPASTVTRHRTDNPRSIK